MSDEVYRVLAARLPHHAGSSVAGLVPVSVSALSDPTWVSAQIGSAARRYRCPDRTVMGVLWWYSTSSVLLAPTVESLLATGVALDPASVTLYLHPDGRPLAARAANVSASPGPALHTVLSTTITTITAVTGANPRALWAIATDSLGNRVLWAGGDLTHAINLARVIGDDLPTPRFVYINGHGVVRRASCCLIYMTKEAAKCVSCPRQTPDDRSQRLYTGR